MEKCGFCSSFLTYNIFDLVLSKTSQMTDEELKAIARVRQLDGAGILAKEDLMPFVAIMEKYNCSVWCAILM